MPNDREPWIKVRVGIVRSDKVASLPSDKARWGWVRVLVEAKLQRQLGMFGSRRHLAGLLGQHGRFVAAYIAAGLLEEAPTICPRCRPQHPDVEAGQLIVHDYRREQRDASNADRQATWRASHRNAPRNGADNASVTADVTHTVTPTVTADSRARGMTETETERDREKAPRIPRRARTGQPAEEPRLTKAQLDAWATFGREWDEVKAAWFAKGLRFPPSGSPDDDDTSQRGLLWQVLDAQPTNLVRWILEAPNASARQVIDHVLACWHEVRIEAGVDEPDPGVRERDRWEAPQRLGGIMAELAKRTPA